MMMLFSSGFVGAMNLIYNLVVAHELGAASFGHASVMYTLLMLVSAVTLSFQLLCSKLVARTELAPVKIGIYRFLHRRAWATSGAITLLLLLATPLISHYLNLPTREYVLLLLLGILFYIPLGARRGLMQGLYDFPHLAGNFALEVLIKLVAAVVLIRLGLGVLGVVGAIVISVVAAYLIARPSAEHAFDSTTVLPGLLGEGIQTSVFFAGQVVINNLDIILVKHFFSATEAGIYAAIALVGRVVYILSWSVVNGMFPFSAGAASDERDGKAALSTALLLVVLITCVFTLGAWLVPASAWHAVLGSGFPSGANNPYASLLVLYAATTGIYALSVVLMSYEISRKIGNVSWLQLGFSGAIIAGIYLLHHTLHQVIAVQMVLMVLLLVSVSIPFLRAQRDARRRLLESLSIVPLTRLRKVSEDEVISEFLKSEFYFPEFEKYRGHLERIVGEPDFSSRRENELRRALLYRRRGPLWRELPHDTEWWEVELQPHDLDRIRIFPRNHWRKLAEKSYYLPDVVESVRKRLRSGPQDLPIAKLQSLSEQIAAGGGAPSSVLIIGLDQSGPFTIIEGNHRMTAAGLALGGEIYQGYRYYCGFSRNMTSCCWYQTDFSTLAKYACNLMVHFLQDPNVLINEALHQEMEE